MTERRKSWQAGAHGAAFLLVTQFPRQLPTPVPEWAWAEASRMPGGPFPQPLKKKAGPQTIQLKPGTTASCQCHSVSEASIHTARMLFCLSQAPFMTLQAQQDLAPHILFKFMVFHPTRPLLMLFSLPGPPPPPRLLSPW